MFTYELKYDLGQKVREEFSGTEYIIETITIEKNRIYYIGKPEGRKVSVAQIAEHLELVEKPLSLVKGER